MSKIMIVGAGAAGAALALFLREEGHDVALYDGRSDSRGSVDPAYRSIAVTLSERGMGVFRRLNLEERVLQRSMTVTGRAIHGRSGEDFTHPYSAEGHTLQCVPRIELDQLLLDAIERTGDVDLHFLHECIGVDFAENRVSFRDKQSGQVKEVVADYVIGADGATSRIRQMLAEAGAVSVETISFAGGYKDFLIPAGEDGNWVMPTGSVHIWPRGDSMFIAFPVRGGEFIAMLFMPAADANDGDQRQRLHCDFPELAPYVADRYESTTLFPLRRIRCSPWTYRGRFTLIGDAAHTILPFYGQGMNASLEDCEVLARCLARGRHDPSPLTSYERIRKPNADAIDELAFRHYSFLSNFAETPESIRRKELETELQRRHPGDFTPLYTLVAFSSLPYETCQRIGCLQGKLLDDLIALPPPFSWESPKVRALYETYRQASRRLRDSADRGRGERQMKHLSPRDALLQK